VPCVLLFVPVESILASAEEHNPRFIDDALSQRVVPRAPGSLSGVLVIVHQAVTTFTVARKSQEVLQLLNESRRGWSKDSEQCAKLGKHLHEMDADCGELEGTRSRQLDELSEQVQMPAHRLPSASWVKKQARISTTGLRPNVPNTFWVPPEPWNTHPPPPPASCRLVSRPGSERASAGR
jgi:hypothetical protein